MNNLNLFTSYVFFALASLTPQKTQGGADPEEEKIEEISGDPKKLLQKSEFETEEYFQKPKDSIKSENSKKEELALKTKEIRKFEDFQKDCGDLKSVLVFGTGHFYEKKYKNSSKGLLYPLNAYLVDADQSKEPDLLMNTDIDELPQKYAGQFDIVIFEGIYFQDEKGAYNPDKAFPNVSKLLKEGGTFLLPFDGKERYKKALNKQGFPSVEYIESIRASKEYGQYVGGSYWGVDAPCAKK